MLLRDKEDGRRHPCSACQLDIMSDRTTWRIVYAVEADAIVVLDVFAKKTSKTQREAYLAEG